MSNNPTPTPTHSAATHQHHPAAPKHEFVSPSCSDIPSPTGLLSETSRTKHHPPSSAQSQTEPSAAPISAQYQPWLLRDYCWRPAGIRRRTTRRNNPNPQPTQPKREPPASRKSPPTRTPKTPPTPPNQPTQTPTTPSQAQPYPATRQPPLSRTSAPSAPPNPTTSCLLRGRNFR